MEKLLQKKCVPCEGGTPPLEETEIEAYLLQLRDGWQVLDTKKLTRKFKFKNFKEAMAFANRVADIAEGEGHHPDFHISYNRVMLELTTHAISGLSENDFIMAAKIDAIGI